MIALILILVSFFLELFALFFIQKEAIRKVLSISSVATLVLANTYLVLEISNMRSTLDGTIVFFLIATLVVSYKVINAIRLYKARMVYRKLYWSVLRASSILGVLLVLSSSAVVFGVGFNIDIFSWLSVVVSGFLLTNVIWAISKQSAKPANHHTTDKTAPTVSILIPARDETEDLLDCLDSVLETDYPKLEILVLDDCSTNKRTAEIIKQFASKGVRFIVGSEPSDEWLGKNNALETLRQQANGQFLVFMGTDVRLKRHTIRNIVDRLHDTNITMASVMPVRADGSDQSIMAPLRYFWELCLPRTLLHRPPALSTFWIIRSDELKKFGGFKGVSRSVMPERHLARFAGKNYRFWLANKLDLAVQTSKPFEKQRQTALIHRYPQAKRRIERVGVYTLTLIAIGVTPVLLIFHSPTLSIISLIFLGLSVTFSEPGLHIVNFVRGLFVVPLLVQEIVLLNLSMVRYEFTAMLWKGRNVCLPVMRVYRSLPKL